MKELSLNVLDITKNSVKAGATKINITINESETLLVIIISDNGCGMTQQVLESVTNPFYTTRTTRKVGMGIPLLKLAAEQTDGNVSIASRHISDYPDMHGTEIKAVFNKKHIDFTPLGDIVSTVVTLIQGSPDIDFCFKHTHGESEVFLDTAQIREVLGADIPLNSFEVIKWITDCLNEQYADLLTINN